MCDVLCTLDNTGAHNCKDRIDWVMYQNPRMSCDSASEIVLKDCPACFNCQQCPFPPTQPPDGSPGGACIQGFNINTGKSLAPCNDSGYVCHESVCASLGSCTTQRDNHQQCAVTSDKCAPLTYSSINDDGSDCYCTCFKKP
jgi:hypothetical protein